MRQGAGPHLRRDLGVLAVVSLVYLLAALFVTNSYYQLILTLVPIWALFGVSWNILSGYGGQLSFGHASFFGIGAYTVTLALVYWDLTPWLGIPLGMLLGGLAAILIGTPDIPAARALLRAVDAGLPAGHPLRHAIPRLPGSLDADAPRAPGCVYMEFADPRVYTLIAVLPAGRRRGRLLADRELALRPGPAGDPAERAGGRGGGHQRAPLEDARADRLRHDRGARPAASTRCVLLVVTPDSVFGMLVSAQAVVVTLFGGVASVWGPVIGAAILVPLAETLQAELGNVPAAASRAWCTASRSSRSCCSRPTGCSGPSATAASGARRPRVRVPGAVPRGAIDGGRSRGTLPATARRSGPLLQVDRAVALLRRPARGQRGQLRRSRRARSSASSARTARARPRCSTC